MVKPLEPGQTLTLTATSSPTSSPAPASLALSVTPSAALDVARCCRRSTAIRSAAPSRSSAARCRCSTPMSFRSICSSPSMPDYRSAHRRGDRDRACRAKGRKARFGLWSRRRRGSLARRLCHRLSDPRAGPRLLGAGRGLQARAGALAQLREHGAGAVDRRRTRRSLTRSTCWRGTASAPVGDLRYLADAKINDLKTATAKAEDRRSARHARRPASAPRRCSTWRSPRSPRNRRSRSAAPTTARRCATPR